MVNGPQAAAASPSLVATTWLALLAAPAAGVQLGSLGGLRLTLVESANESDAFGSPMGSVGREKSRTPEGGRPTRKRRLAARPKGGGFDAADLDEDPVMDFSDTEPAVTEEAQRLAITAARHAFGVASPGSAPALPGAAAAGAAACG